MQTGTTRAKENRAIRQEELRAKLSAGSHIQHVIDNANKLQELGTVLEPNDIQRLKIASELKLKLINKYLPDVKQVELDANIGLTGDMKHELVRAVIVNETHTTT